MRERIIRFLLSYIDVASAEEFSEADIKTIDDWLNSSSTHRGFTKYLRSRDRAFVQAMVNLPLSVEAERAKFYEYRGARLEIARLMKRAISSNEKRTKAIKDDEETE